MVLSPAATSAEIDQRWDETILDVGTEILLRWDKQFSEARADREMSSEAKSATMNKKQEASEYYRPYESVVAGATRRKRGR